MSIEETALRNAELRLKRLEAGIRAFQEDMSDLRSILERRNEDPISWEAFMEELRRSRTV